jgi:hypothetical protein
METGKASCPLVHDGQSPIRQKKKTEKSERFWKETRKKIKIEERDILSYLD